MSVYFWAHPDPRAEDPEKNQIAKRHGLTSDMGVISVKYGARRARYSERYRPPRAENLRHKTGVRS